MTIPKAPHQSRARPASSEAAQLQTLREENAQFRDALQRIANGAADGLDGARDTAVLERCIRLAQRALITKRTP